MKERKFSNTVQRSTPTAIEKSNRATGNYCQVTNELAMTALFRPSFVQHKNSQTVKLIVANYTDKFWMKKKTLHCHINQAIVILLDLVEMPHIS